MEWSTLASEENGRDKKLLFGVSLCVCFIKEDLNFYVYPKCRTLNLFMRDELPSGLSCLPCAAEV